MRGGWYLCVFWNIHWKTNSEIFISRNPNVGRHVLKNNLIVGSKYSLDKLSYSVTYTPGFAFKCLVMMCLFRALAQDDA